MYRYKDFQTVITLNSNSNLNMNNFTSNRFTPRQQYYPPNQEKNTGMILFEGRMKYNEDLHTDLRIHIDQTVDISLLTMHCWDKQCNLHYLNYIDAYQIIIYGKSITDIDGGGTDVVLKTAMEVHKTESSSHGPSNVYIIIKIKYFNCYN